MNENRGSWYLLTGVIIGVGLGLLVSWVLWPVRYRDNVPGSLSEEYKDDYRALIAAAYMSSGSLQRARNRLSQLGDPDMAAALITQAQRSMLAGHPDAEVQALSLLGLNLASESGPTPEITLPATFTLPPIATLPDTATPTETVAPSPVIAWTPTPVTETESPLSATNTPHAQAGSPNPGTGTPAGTATTTNTPLPTFTPVPSLTPTPTLTPGQPFQLAQKEIVCNTSLPQPLIQVQVRNSQGPLAGIEGFVLWNGGSDRFITGLKPEMGLGYADFIMKSDQVYTIQLVNGEPVRDLSVNQCTNANGDHYLGGWLLVFEQP